MKLAMNEKTKNWSIELVIIGIFLLSGCATIQIMGKSLLQSPPSFIVIGDIAIHGIFF